MAKYACAIVLFFAFSLTATNTNAESVHRAALGTKVSGLVEIGGAQFVLPPGDWVVMGRHRRQASKQGGPPAPAIGAVYLGEVRKGVLRRTVIAEANLDIDAGGWTRWKECDRTDLIHLVADQNYNGRDQQCWWINSFSQKLTTGPRGDPNHFREAFQYMDDHGIRRPRSMVGVVFVRADRGQFLLVRYTFNPEVTGIKPTVSEWHRDRYVNDPKKVALVENLKGWGEGMLPMVREGVRKNLSANVSLPRVPME